MLTDPQIISDPYDRLYLFGRSLSDSLLGLLVESLVVGIVQMESRTSVLSTSAIPIASISDSGSLLAEVPSTQILLEVYFDIAHIILSTSPDY